MSGTKEPRRILVLCVLAALASVTAGCSVGAHSAASSPAAASSPVYLAQVTCWNTMSCCIQRWPLSAAQNCGASAAEIAEVLNGAKVLHDATRTEGVNFKEEAHEHESVESDEASEAAESGEPPPLHGPESPHHLPAHRQGVEETSNPSRSDKPRDERFVLKAKDEESHCGYQQWHRDVDQEVIRWLRREATATKKQFEKFLREIYNRPEMRKRFPDGL